MVNRGESGGVAGAVQNPPSRSTSKSDTLRQAPVPITNLSASAELPNPARVATAGATS